MAQKAEHIFEILRPHVPDHLAGSGRYTEVLRSCCMDADSTAASENSTANSVVRRQELLDLERELLDNLAALQLRVTRLEFRLSPLARAGASSDSGDSTGSHISDVTISCIWQLRVLPALWAFCDTPSRAHLLQLSCDISADQIRPQLRALLFTRAFQEP